MRVETEFRLAADLHPGAALPGTIPEQPSYAIFAESLKCFDRGRVTNSSPIDGAGIDSSGDVLGSPVIEITECSLLQAHDDLQNWLRL